jgi:hypothetical protein
MEKKPRKYSPGRPKIPDSERRDGRVLYIKLTHAERALLDSVQCEHLTVWARDLILAAAKRAKKSQP